MKKSLWIALILMLVCIFSFSACDQEDTPPNNGDVPSTQQPSDNNDDELSDNNNSGDSNAQCQHAWGEWLTIKPATCKEEGQLIRVCDKCSVSEQTTAAKSETHTEVIDAAISATCTVDGKTEGKHCSVCSITLIEQTTVKATGHTEVVDKAVAATCKTEGKTEGKHCSVCNDIIVKQDVVPKSDHTEVIDEAVASTCTSEGKTEGKHCSVCGIVIVGQTTVAKSNHIEVVDDAVSPTCTSEGKTEGKHCSVCKKVIVAQTSIDTIDHTYDNGACTVCKCMDVDSKNAEILAENERHEQSLEEIEENHEYWISYAQEEISSIKLEYGISYVYDVDYCYECLTDIAEEIEYLEKCISALSGDNSSSAAAQRQRYRVQISEKEEEKDIYYAHIDINDWQDEIELEQLALADDISGENRLHKENLDAINAKYECAVNGHTVVVDKAVAPTCTATGKTEGSHCSNCGFVITAQSTVESLGHTEVIDEAVKETCTMDGTTEGSHCSVCGDIIVMQEKIEKHHIEVIDPAVEATCTTDGITEGKHCSACGDILIEQMIVEKHHNEIVDPKIESTCTNPGKTEGKHCISCNEVIIPQIDIPMKEHTIGSWTANEQESEMYLKCLYCNYSFDSKLISQGIEYKLNDDGLSYRVLGIGTCTDVEIVISPTHNGYPVTAISNNAFKNNNRLTSVFIPDNVTSIGKHAFYNTPLVNAYLGNAVTTIGEYAFWSCDSLVELYLGNSLKKIETYAFWSCNSLTEITFPDTVTSIEPNAFYGCISLTSVSIPPNLTSIASRAFAVCSSLTSVTIGKNVEYIGEYAFGDCTLLLTINYEGTKSQWNKISKSSKWNSYTGNYVVYCVDGTEYKKININN